MIFLFQELFKFPFRFSTKFMFHQEGISTEQIVQGYYWAPVIEPIHEGAFLTNRQYGILESGDINKVPLIIGICSEESIQRALGKYFMIILHFTIIPTISNLTRVGEGAIY